MGWPSQATKHDADHGQAHESRGGSGVTLEVACQAAIPADPGQGSFDDPAFGEDDEVMSIAALDDLDHPAAGIGDCLCGLRSLIAGIGEDALDEGLWCKWPSRANAPFYAVQTLSPKYRVPDCMRSSALNAQTPQSELSLADAMHQLDAGNRGRRILEVLEACHHSDALLDAPMVLLNQVVQVLRRAQLRVSGQRAIGFQRAHRTVRCSVAVQCDCLRGALLAFERFAKEHLGRRDVALGAQPEVDRPARPVNGTVEVAPLASDLDVCLVDAP